MGCYLITETMTRRHELSMKSYDRLFPNQDTMPRGGFGNLIALPLQYEPRQQGNSVFVDECLEPYADQWAFLASVQRIEPGTAEIIAQEATRTGQVIGVRFAEILDDQVGSAPWTRSQPILKSSPTIIGSLPSVVRGVLAQRLYIEKAGLPAPLLNQLKRLAAFQNPEFYKKQRMGETRKAKKDGIYRATERGDSTYQRAQAEAVAADLLTGNTRVEPGKRKLGETRRQVENGWRAVANRLSMDGHHDLANDVRRFVERMPPAKTDREQIAQELQQRVRDARVRDLRHTR